MRGSMREKRPGYWELRVDIGTDPETGKRTQRSRTLRGTRRDAETALSVFVAEVTAGATPRVTATVAELANRWVDHVELTMSPKTVHEYRRLIDGRIRPALGTRPLRWVTPMEIDSFYADLLRDGLSAGSVRHIHAVLSGSFNQAVKWGLLATSPVARTTPPPVPKPEVAPPTPETVARLVTAATESDPDFGMFVRLAAVTGARRGELCALRWPDVDRPEGSLTIRRALVDVGGAVSEKPTKTNQARRIALDQHTLDALAAHRTFQEQRADTLGVALDPNAFVCSHTPDGTRPLRPDQATSRFRHLTRALDAPHVRLHDIRHFAATHLLAAGVPAQTVSQRLGPTTPTTTLNAYSHYQRPSDQHAADILGNIP